MSKRTRYRPLIVLGLLAALLVGILGADWWTCLPEDTTAEFVGGHRCVQCHQEESRMWQGSHHDLAMDVATPDTVLGDFNDATIEHYGITSRMYRDGDRYFVTTEGPDGEIADFEVKYVFGVEPLQQYMVEFDRPNDMPQGEIARLQVLRISWDTEREKWFFLSPPDVAERLSPDDPLHWTGVAQNWNHMCAECHSTNLQKNYDLATATYHTTFSDIDVSCEACHGPGSIHVGLASAKSPFWDRKLGYGLAKLKTESSEPQIQACAPCHSRRSIVAPNYHGGENYYDHFANTLIEPELYYCDGQVRDEVYVYGSFIQSKMYKEGIRCTDCHNPHTTKVKFTGNQLCTSCHTHEAAKYDTPAHHRHKVGSTGASCVECHMPETPYMDVDLRRDHSLRVPRPDLSVALGTPNACTGCHLELKNVSPDRREELQYYADWLQAARDGDKEVRDEIARVDRWAAEQARQWYGEPKPDKDRVEFAAVLNEGWKSAPDAHTALADLAKNRRAAGIVRASALSRLAWYPAAQRTTVSTRLLDDSDPQIRAAAVQNLSELPRRELLETLSPLLDDPIRYVRIQAALALAGVPDGAFTTQQREQRAKSLDEYRASLALNSDLAGSHMALGVLAERQGNASAAANAYRTAIRVQPDVTGPRTNLAALLEAQGKVAETEALRAEELELLARDSVLAPQSAAVQYRYGLALYLAGREQEAETALAVAYELEPNTPDYCLALALLYQKQQRFDESLPLAERVLELRPSEPGYQQLYIEIRAAAQEKDGL